MSKVETLGFQTEVKALLHLMIHSLYSNQEIFLRELISNASDALDKLRFLSINEPNLSEGDSQFQITVTANKDKHILTLSDNGIGMSYDEVIQNLGTIAKSGTKEFIQSLSGNQNKDVNLIGQFGVGFYSAFMVSDDVTVYSRKAGLPAENGVKWHSKGDGQFHIETIKREARGTEIVIKLRKDSYDYAEESRIKHIVHQYSDHILFPIMLDGKQINSTEALWTKSKADITDEQYQEFYHHISHDFHKALEWIHYHVEGKQQYIALLYIPEAQSPDLFHQERKNGLKLFIERVFIMDNAALLPHYLRFIKGVIDSSDLPLNISREILQANPVSEKIKTGLTKKILQTLSKMAEDSREKYEKFWGQFGVVLKEGVSEDFQHQKELLELLRFASTQSNEAAQTTALKDYVGRMGKDQNSIYYIIADQFTTAQNSPHLEAFREKGIEVLLLSDRIDEWMMAYLPEYEGKKFQSVTKGDIELNAKKDQNEKKDEPVSSEFGSLLKQMSETLKDQVQEVRASKRLKDSPVCLVAEEAGLSLHLQRLMKDAGHALPTVKPILEINEHHPVIAQLLGITDETLMSEWTLFLYNQALLAEGGQLSNPALFVKQMNAFILKNR